MIRATRSGVSTANLRQASHTVHDWRRKFGLTRDLLLRVLLGLCYITGTCCEWKDRMSRGTKELQAAMSRPPQSGQCDLEMDCDWSWKQTHRFRRITPSAGIRHGPTTDASKSEKGHFLWFNGSGIAQMWSSRIPRTGSRCELELSLYQVGMNDGGIKLIIITNDTSSIAADKPGNNHAIWEVTRFKLGAISQPHGLLVEMRVPYPNSSIGIDNIHLIECFPELAPVGAACTEDMFRCNNGSCLNRTRVCDLTKDCADGEDEVADCDKIPENARCNFEHGWCGWRNVPGRPLNWTLHRGPTTSEKTGPSYDHTYRTAFGIYAYVNMSKKVDYGSRATIESPVYNPTPLYSNDPKSRYHQSCQVRFFYHQYGAHSGSLALYLVQMKPHQNHSESLWWSYGDRSDVWYDQAVALPDIRYRYFLQFEASRGFSSKGDVAIDDFSLSPECFGIGVPPDVVGDFNYYNPVIDSERVPNQHADFLNKTVIRVTSCGATGRTGPTAEQCAEVYNGTDVTLLAENSSLNLNGVQQWTAPRGGYYTLIGMGAGGGKGSSGMGITLGASVRGVIELEKGDQLYFMVGQAGTDACVKNLGLNIDTCHSGGQAHRAFPTGTPSIVREVMNIQIKDGGGGGGGATYIFKMKKNGEQQPVIVAGGGGGLGMGQFVDNGIQHGRGPAPFVRRPASTANIPPKAGGPGGGWNGPSRSYLGQRTSAGMPLVQGGIGGIRCGPGNQSHGNGGFGGGGGGCLSGGGGGGYIGGDTSHKVSTNGEGGYSYASRELMHAHFRPGINHGAGEVYIVPAISGCGCDFRCVALDQYLSETKCVCPPGWLLSNDSRSCVMADDSKVSHQTFMILLITVSVGLVCAFTALCLLLCKKLLNNIVTYVIFRNIEDVIFF